MTDLPVHSSFHIALRPSGSACNLRCEYCYFPKNEHLSTMSDSFMPEEVHESCIRQLLEASRTPLVNISWQGGEPALMGLAFFKNAIELQTKYRRPGTRIENIFYTNGTLLNDQWCEFFHANDFLVNLSMDGPRDLQDFYRRNKHGRGTFHKVFKTAGLLQKYQVNYSIICMVNRMNGRYPIHVYRFFRDEVKARQILFIPLVERDSDSGCQQGSSVTSRSVRPHQWGRFLVEIFDEWVKQDVDKISVRNFNDVLTRRLGLAGSICTLRPTCGRGMTFDYNGDVYPCSRFVEPGHCLGNILTIPLKDLSASEKQIKFGNDKLETLPGSCRECAFLSLCNGGCPKDRLVALPHDKTYGLNYLCAGYKAFFRHSGPAMETMTELTRQGRPVSHVMSAPVETAKEPGTVCTTAPDTLPI